MAISAVCFGGCGGEHEPSPQPSTQLLQKSEASAVALSSACDRPAVQNAAQDPARPFFLGATTHFSVGEPQSLIPTIGSISVAYARDTVNWEHVIPAPFPDEGAAPPPGSPPFAYIEKLAGSHIGLLFVPRLTHQFVSGGETVTSERDVSAWRDYIAATLANTSDMHAIEVGNEFNTSQFVSGPLKNMTPDQRIPAYMALVAAARRTVADSGRNVEVWGGATHSIPVDYIKALFDAGLGSCIDALAIHPYSSVPAQLDDQIAVLRQTIDSRIPVEVTEFGQLNISSREQADYMVRMVGAMAGSGIRSAAWYPVIAEQWSPGMELMDGSGRLTAAGRAFANLTSRVLPSGPPRPLPLGPFMRGTAFGTGAAIVWGDPASVTIDAAATVTDATGVSLSPPYKLDPVQPLIVFAPQNTAIDQTIKAAPSTLIADSFWQFALLSPTRMGWSNPWRYAWRTQNGEWKDLSVMGGGHRSGEPWFPYMGNEYQRPFAVTAELVAAIPTGDGERETIVLNDPGHYQLDMTLQTEPKAPGDARFTVEVDGRAIFTGAVGHDAPVTQSIAFETSKAATLAITLSRQNAQAMPSVRRRYTVKRTAP